METIVRRPSGWGERQTARHSPFPQSAGGRLGLAAAIFFSSLPHLTGQPSPASTEILSLDRVIAMALEHNRQLQASALDIQRAEDRLAALRTRRLPALSFSALGGQRLTRLDFVFNSGAFGTFPGIGPVPSQTTTIQTPLQPAGLLMGRIAQPLSQQYKLGLGIEQLKLGRQIAVELDRQQKQAIVEQVKRAYYEILQTESALEAVEQSIRLYRELDRLTGQYVAEQVALKGQSLEVKARLAKAEYDALALRDPLATQQELLNSLLGRDIRTAFRVSAVADAAWEPGDLEAARAIALHHRPELKQAQLKVEQADYDRRIKKAEQIPDVSLAFNYLSPLNFGGLIPGNFAMVGVAVEWEPFDWHRKSHELAEKTRVVSQATLAVKEAEDQILIDVGNRFRKLMEARQMLAVTQLAQEAAAENLRVQTDRYKQDSALLKDVLQMQAALAEGNSHQRQALLAFWTARADFEKSLGEDQ